MGKIGKPQKSGKHKKMKPTFDTKKKSTLLVGNKKEKFKNLCPENVDDQEIPRKVKDLMRLKDDLKNGKIQKKKNKLKNKKNTQKKAEPFRMERGMSRPLKPAPRFIQGKFETEYKFMRRVENETQKVLTRAKIEDKYKIDVTDNGNGNSNVEIKKKSSDKKKQKDKDRKKKKLERIRDKKREKRGDFSSFKDDVEFGEVAMQPPSLTAKPRKGNTEEGIQRPGKRSLLLKDMMEGTSNSSISTKKDAPETNNKTNINPKSLAQRPVGQTVKRKYLSPAQKRISDTERLNAINIYRKMKDEKLKQMGVER